MKLEYCCSPIICVTGRGLCIAVQYSQNACFSCHFTLLKYGHKMICSVDHYERHENAYKCIRWHILQHHEVIHLSYNKDYLRKTKPGACWAVKYILCVLYTRGLVGLNMSQTKSNNSFSKKEIMDFFFILKKKNLFNYYD